MQFKCEYCGKKHKGDYASGRFCNVKCARAFATKACRSEINERVSKTLKLRGHASISEELIEQIPIVIEQTKSMSQAAKALGINYLTFRKYAMRLDIWKPNSGPGRDRHSSTKLDDVLTGKHNGRFINLRKRLLRTGIKQNKCEVCKITHWQNESITCHLDHINGDSTDHRIENLRMLCPNCHSQTPTWCAKNKKQGLHTKMI